MGTKVVCIMNIANSSIQICDLHHKCLAILLWPTALMNIKSTTRYIAVLIWWKVITNTQYKRWLSPTWTALKLYLCKKYLWKINDYLIKVTNILRFLYQNNITMLLPFTKSNILKHYNILLEADFRRWQCVLRGGWRLV